MLLDVMTHYGLNKDLRNAGFYETEQHKRIDDLEPTLIRHGYNERALVEQFRIKLTEVRRFLKGDLDSARMLELAEEMREAGLPI
jgi:hypothetical protein